MLVLARKRGEKIVLPDLGIEFAITEIRGNVVRVGITAPNSITILRGELSEIQKGKADPIEDDEGQSREEATADK